MNPSSFCSVPAPAETVNTQNSETLTLDELRTALAQKSREAARTTRLTREMAEATIRDLEERIHTVQAIETVNTCPECWIDTGAVMIFLGRGRTSGKARAEEDAFDAAQCRAWEEMDFGRHDQMSSLGSVLAGMGF